MKEEAIDLTAHETDDGAAQEIAEGGGGDFVKKEPRHSSLRSSFEKHQGETLSWSNMNMVVKGKKGKEPDRHILRDVWGEARPGELTAIMGPSGAGKTSLLNILAGRAKSNKLVSIDSKVTLGGNPLDVSKLSTIREKIAFVAQEDALHAASTPREAIHFSARLRLPRSCPDDEINEIVESYIKELGLESCADTMIGGGLKKGISGGEKKRTSIGVELVVLPSIIFLDEPTSGLDSFSAEQVCKVLKRVAVAGTSVLFTIHQPSPEVFDSFDKLLLLNKGRLMYQGRVTGVEQDFETCGHPIPPHFNPADWILRVAQGTSEDVLQQSGFYRIDDRPSETASEITMQVASKGDRVLMRTELYQLFLREKRTLVRNPFPFIMTMAITAFLALLYGIFFFDVGELDRTNPTDIQAQLGAIVNVLISTMMGQAQLSLTTFPAERPLFLREYSTNHYSVVAYFLSKFATELFNAFSAMMLQSLIVYYMIKFSLSFILFFFINFSLALTSTAVAVLLGSALSDPSGAPQFFTLMVVPQFYFSGVFIPIDLIPSFVRWAQYLCSLRYASGLSMIYEFSDCEPGLEQVNCDNILERNDVSSDDTWWFWLALWGLFAVFRLGALGLLRKRANYA